MIVTRLMGGHSNQLFQYAAGRSLAEKLQTELLLDARWFEENKNIPDPRQYELDCYPLKAKITDMGGIRITDPRQAATTKQKLLSRLSLNKNVTRYYEEGIGFNKDVLNLPNNTMLDGYWQCEKYFAHIRPALLKEFEPIKPPNKTNLQQINRMHETESVWMHVRRGDYVTNEVFKAFHGLKDVAYYQAGLKLVESKLSAKKHQNIEIFICSNDIAWCKKNLQFKYPTHFVENKLGSDDMRVVKHCKHDVIANSSFSWWGAWLNDNPDKIVVAPKVWFMEKKANREIDIIPESWHTL